MNQKFKFKEFSEKNNPKITMPVAPKPTKKEWVVGAKFMRPENHILGGEVLEITRIEGERIYGPDGLWTTREYLTLV